jgi:alkylation response protein AidB-like acyl-CoA dehydrogenase
MDDGIDLGALRESVAEVLRDQATHEIVLRHQAHGRGRLDALWATAGELGWTALALPEAHGGLGLEIDALVPIYEELGRVAAPLPYLATMLAAEAIARAGDEAQQAAWLPAIAGGAAAALSDPAPLDTAPLSLVSDGGKIRLSGTLRDLLDADGAALIVALAAEDGGALHRVILTPEDAIRIEARPLWDHGHTLADVHADDVRLPADRAMPTSAAIEEGLLVHAALGLAAEAIGGSDAILEVTINYLKTREQFGKPLGSFQALKHRVADHRTRTVAGRALLEAATLGVATGDPLGAREAHAAKVLACGDYVTVARDGVQLHGGMGFTAEQPCHLYLKRALLNQALFGAEGVHLARATDDLLAGETA